MELKFRTVFGRTALTGAAVGALAMLGGCGVSNSTPPTNYTPPVTLQGQVFAGRNYMANATVKVYVTQPTGVASKGVYTGAAKLLQTVKTNDTGGFSVQSLSCTSPDQLYVTAEGGIPYPSNLNSTTLTNNANSLMMTAIGDCSILTSATASNSITSIVVNEASTVAAVTALRPFISLSGTTVNVTSSATNYAGASGTGTPGKFAGLAHAFLNANNLSPYKIGNFQQYTKGGDSGTAGGLVPVQLLNTLAYVQYLCTIGGVGGAGDFSYCTTLYQLATPPGGTAPTNSLQAMLNIASYPTNNAAGILAFSLTPIPLAFPAQLGPQQINAGVYVPALNAFVSPGGTALTNDFSVAIYYLPGYGAVTGGQGGLYPNFVTIDANDNVFFSNPSAATSTSGNVIALRSDGTPLWTSLNDTTGLVQPRAIAADQTGHVWVTSGGTTTAQAFVQEMDSATGATIQRFPSTSNTLYGVAVDSLGNVWYDSNTTVGQNLHELVRNGGAYTEATFTIPPAVPTSQLLQIRPDSSNNIWVAGYGSATAQAVYFPNTGTAAAPTYTGGLKVATLPGSSPYGVATDASGRAYIVTNGTTGGMNRVAVTGTGAAAVLTPTLVAPSPAASNRFMDIDGGGAIWFLDNGTGTPVYRYDPVANATTGFYPCYNAGTATGTGNTAGTVSSDGKTVPITAGTQYCATGISNRIDLAVDSTGSVWVASSSNSGGGRMVQIIGLATPTVPLKALGQPGVMP